MNEQHKPKSWKDLTSEKYFKYMTDEPIKEFTESDMLAFAMSYGNGTLEQTHNALKRYKEREQQKQYPEGIRSFKDKEGVEWFGSSLRLENSYPKWVERCLNLGGKIWSVQNGNEILTVGDKIQGERGVATIEKILISTDNDLRIFTSEHRNIKLPNESLKKLQPLFQIDGKGIYDGDEYYYVMPTLDIISELAKKDCERMGSPAGSKIFLTQALAEEYVKENKPQYSTKEMRECWNTARAGHYKLNYNQETFNSFEDYEKYLTSPKPTPP